MSYSSFIYYIIYNLTHLFCQMMVKFCIHSYHKLVIINHVYIIHMLDFILLIRCINLF